MRKVRAQGLGEVVLLLWLVGVEAVLRLLLLGGEGGREGGVGWGEMRARDLTVPRIMCGKRNNPREAAPGHTRQYDQDHGNR